MRLAACGDSLFSSKNLVNRLDQPVEGIVLIGKNEKAAADLSRQVTVHIHMEKWYQTVVCG